MVCATLRSRVDLRIQRFLGLLCPRLCHGAIVQNIEFTYAPRLHRRRRELGGFFNLRKLLWRYPNRRSVPCPRSNRRCRDGPAITHFTAHWAISLRLAFEASCHLKQAGPRGCPPRALFWRCRRQRVAAYGSSPIFDSNGPPPSFDGASRRREGWNPPAAARPSRRSPPAGPHGPSNPRRRGTRRGRLVES